jgi:hypothetical protein
MGTYRVHPDADNFLELAYPDTGETETVYTDILENQLTLPASWGSENETRKHQRVENKEMASRPVREDAVTAFALFKECAADPAKAKEKHAGKPLELSGGVSESRTLNGESEIYLCTGKAGRVRCVMDTKDKATAVAIQKIQSASVDGRNLHVVTVKGQFGGMVKGKDAGANPVEGAIVRERNDERLFLLVTGCRIADLSELTLK